MMRSSRKRVRLVRDDIVYLPLHHQVIVWAMRTELDLPIHPFNYPQFRYARFVSARDLRSG